MIFLVLLLLAFQQNVLLGSSLFCDAAAAEASSVDKSSTVPSTLASAAMPSSSASPSITPTTNPMTAMASIPTPAPLPELSTSSNAAPLEEQQSSNPPSSNNLTLTVDEHLEVFEAKGKDRGPAKLILLVFFVVAFFVLVFIASYCYGKARHNGCCKCITLNGSNGEEDTYCCSTCSSNHNDWKGKEHNGVTIATFIKEKMMHNNRKKKEKKKLCSCHHLSKTKNLHVRTHHLFTKVVMENDSSNNGDIIMQPQQPAMAWVTVVLEPPPKSSSSMVAQ